MVNKLAQNNHRAWAAQVIDQPFKRQLLLITNLFGYDKKIGILLGPSSSGNKDEIKQAARATGLTVNYRTIKTTEDLMPALKEIIIKNDVLLAAPDPVVHNKK